MKVSDYIRIGTDRQNLEKQGDRCLGSVRENQPVIDDFIVVEGSSKKSPKERLIKHLFVRLNE